MPVVSALASCSGGSSSSSSDPEPPVPVPPGELDLAGTPLATIVAGTRYCFLPSVAYNGNSAVEFTVANLPDWADYDAASGELSGQPDVGDVGTYADIRVTASAGGEQDALGPFSIEVVASAPGTAELAWLAPTQRIDGSPLVDLAGYKLYWGPAEDSLCNSVTIANPSIDTFLVEGLTPAAWHFAATAFDSTGVESGFSASVSKMISN